MDYLLDEPGLEEAQVLPHRLVVLEGGSCGFGCVERDGEGQRRGVAS